jgi:mitochondrial fission protein ELM1
MAFVAPTDTPDLLEAPSPLRAGGGHTVAAQIRKPGIGRAEFDQLVVFKHDRLRGPGVIATRAAVHRATQARLPAERHRFPALATRPWPIPSALISRTNRACRSTPRRSDKSNAKLARFHEAMKAAGITLPFSGRVEGCSDPSPDATTRACIELQILVLGRRKWS